MTALVLAGGAVAGCSATPAVTDLPTPDSVVGSDSPPPQVVIPSPSPFRPPQTPPAGAPAPD